MKQTIYFEQTEEKLHYHLNQGEVKEVDLKEEKIVEIIEEKLKETDSLHIMVQENSSAIFWEELSSVDGFPFACNSHTTLAHSVKTKNNKTAIPRRKLMGALKVLVVGCDPDTLPPLNIEAEFIKINSALIDLEQRGIVEVKRTEVTDLNSLVILVQNEKPDIFHFIGHTIENTKGEYELALKSRNAGLAKGVTSEQLSGLLVNKSVQFAFINACKSSNIAYNLAREGLATIGMRKEIRDESSKLFAETLYNSLVNGEPIDIAINNARHSLYLNNKENQDWSYPILYISNHEVLGFKIEPEPVPMSEVMIECSNTKHVNIFIDGKLAGLTPLKTKVRIDYLIEIRMEKEGYKSLTKKFIATNPKEFFTENLDPILGKLVVETHPKVANIDVKCQRIDNPKECLKMRTNALGEATFNELPVGEYEVYTSYELKGLKVNIEEKSQSKPLEIKFPIEMHLSHGMATVGTLILEWLRETKTIIIGFLFLLLTIGTFLFFNQSDKTKKTPDGMVEIKGTKKYIFLGMDISKENTPQLKGESDYAYKERLKLSQLMIDEMRSAESAKQVQRYWGDEPKTYRLKNNFYIDKTEVTVGQYQKFINLLKNNPSLIKQYQHQLDKDEKNRYKKTKVQDFIPIDWANQINCLNCPVVNVDYFMAWAYAKSIGKRIPTAIEWEMASKGKEGRIFPWGNEYEPWRYNGYTSKDTRPTTVGNLTYEKSKTPNGIFDMAGNVDELVVVKESKLSIELGVKGGSVSSRAILLILNYGTFLFSDNNRISKHTGFRCVSDNNTLGMILIEKGVYHIGGIHNYYFDLIRKLNKYDGDNLDRLIGESPLDMNESNNIPYLKNGLETFYINEHEVTVGEYSLFLDEMAKNIDLRNHILRQMHILKLKPEPANWEEQLKDTNKPVGYVSWLMATAYCASQDKRLPTIFEYEYLIGGANGYIYPSEKEYFNEKRAIENFRKGQHAMNLANMGQRKLMKAVDERFKNDLGVYHIVGNVAEWANDPRYETGNTAYLKGGDFKIHGEIGASRFFKYRLKKEVYNNEEVGFRCAKDK